MPRVNARGSKVGRLCFRQPAVREFTFAPTAIRETIPVAALATADIWPRPPTPPNSVPLPIASAATITVHSHDL